MAKVLFMKGKKIAAWFSCGAASAVAAKLTIKKYGGENTVMVLNTPIANEHEDNRRFLNDVAEWIGQEIELVTNPEYKTNDINEVFKKRKYMEGIAGAPCTKYLKKRARQLWERENEPDHTVLGFTFDELDRYKLFCKTERPVLPILIEHKITKQDCFDFVNSAGIDLPEIYKQGYANANCIGCVKATSPTYWNHVRKTYPDIFDERCALSREIGCKLVRHKGERIFLDELPPDAKGRPLKEFDIECGLFCEEFNIENIK